MILPNRESFKSCFTFICTIVVAFMVGYWFYKYEVEDRDIGVVDYVELEDTEDIKFPSISVCFKDPFLEKYLRAENLSITRQMYTKYLAGEFNDEMYEQIDYSNVTLDLRKYLVSGGLTWQNGTIKSNLTGLVKFTETFNGFYSTNMFKCFSLEYDGEEKREIRSVDFLFDRYKLLGDWPGDSRGVYYLSVFVFAHYPGQFYLHKINEAKETPLHGLHGIANIIQELEFLNQRNSRNRRCSEHTDDYDKTVIDELLSRSGCRPPYLNSHQFYPKCNDMIKIKDECIR